MIRTTLAHGRLRAALTTLVIAVLGVALLAPSAHATPSTSLSVVAAPEVTWTACRDGFECAVVPVPLDHGDLKGEQIGISVIRLPAGEPSRRIGSLLVNPGGPGGSGVDVVRASAKILPLELRASFDIVGFDPRGTGLSTPLRCFDTLEQAIATLPPIAFPDLPDEEEVQRVSDDALAGACAQHGGTILDHMSTADTARDMDLLRAALGDEQLTYLVLSYG